jgi:predicted dehydrogenase
MMVQHAPMRLAFTGVSHWHLPLYLDPALATPGHQVVAVSDPDRAVANRVAARIGATAWTDWRAMFDRERPDFVFVLGRHCDMAEVARAAIDLGIPCAIEKPCGIDGREVADLAARAAAAGAFAAVPFVLRESRMMETIRAHAQGERVHYLSFKFIGGSVDRYRQAAGCDWMLDRRTSGGGCLLNLGVHFLDLARVLFTEPPAVTAALMSSAVDGLDTEDHAAVLLRAGSGACLIETGYTYPAPHMTFDMHFSIRTANHYFAAKDSEALEVLTTSQNRSLLPMGMTNVPYYPHFVRDVVARAARGDRPVADLSDMQATMTLVEAAYAAAARSDTYQHEGAQ